MAGQSPSGAAKSFGSLVELEAVDYFLNSSDPNGIENPELARALSAALDQGLEIGNSSWRTSDPITAYVRVRGGHMDRLTIGGVEVAQFDPSQPEQITEACQNQPIVTLYQQNFQPLKDEFSADDEDLHEAFITLQNPVVGVELEERVGGYLNLVRAIVSQDGTTWAPRGPALKALDLMEHLDGLEGEAYRHRSQLLSNIVAAVGSDQVSTVLDYLANDDLSPFPQKREQKKALYLDVLARVGKPESASQVVELSQLEIEGGTETVLALVVALLGPRPEGQTQKEALACFRRLLQAEPGQAALLFRTLQDSLHLGATDGPAEELAEALATLSRKVDGRSTVKAWPLVERAWSQRENFGFLAQLGHRVEPGHLTGLGLAALDHAEKDEQTVSDLTALSACLKDWQGVESETLRWTGKTFLTDPHRDQCLTALRAVDKEEGPGPTRSSCLGPTRPSLFSATHRVSPQPRRPDGPPGRPFEPHCNPRTRRRLPLDRRLAGGCRIYLASASLDSRVRVMRGPLSSSTTISRPRLSGSPSTRIS